LLFDAFLSVQGFESLSGYLDEALLEGSLSGVEGVLQVGLNLGLLDVARDLLKAGAVLHPFNSLLGLFPQLRQRVKTALKIEVLLNVLVFELLHWLVYIYHEALEAPSSNEEGD